MVLGIIHISEQSLFFNQIRLRDDHNVMRDRCATSILRFFSLFYHLINDIKNIMNLIGICSKETNLFIVAPDMRYILEIIKVIHLFRRCYKHELYFIVGMK